MYSPLVWLGTFHTFWIQIKFCVTRTLTEISKSVNSNPIRYFYYLYVMGNRFRCDEFWFGNAFQQLSLCYHFNMYAVSIRQYLKVIYQVYAKLESIHLCLIPLENICFSSSCKKCVKTMSGSYTKIYLNYAFQFICNRLYWESLST